MSKTDKSKAEAPKRRTLLSKVKASYVIIALLLVALIGGGYFGYQKYDDLEQEKQSLADPQEAARQETQRIKDQVAKLIDVPQDEDPTIASVVDASKLSSQAFFKKAQNGDKVLMYAEAKRAILFRPSTNKIIEVAPINIGENQETDKAQKPAGTE